MQRHKQGFSFTLIELLIVVAIIAILAAIAVPNFLEAQTRSKVSRCYADMRTLALAIESYHVDHDEYPWYPDIAQHPLRGLTPVTLTTPLAYLTMLPRDAFKVSARNSYPTIDEALFPNPNRYYNYETRAQYGIGGWDGDGPGDWIKWILVGVGPDLWIIINEGTGFHGNAPEYFSDRSAAQSLGGWYDPTNGTISRGDMIYWGPGGNQEFPGLR